MGCWIGAIGTSPTLGFSALASSLFQLLFPLEGTTDMHATQTRPIRAQYPQAVRELVLRKYPCCRTIEDKLALAHEVADLTGMPTDDPQLLQKLYNLACRLGATRKPFAGTLARSEPDPARLELRDDPETLVWTAADDRYLTQNWAAVWIEDIAFQLNRSETAVAYRARQLELRAVARFYEADKVAAWLCLRRAPELDELRVLDKLAYGLLHPVAGADGTIVAELVSTPAIYRLLLDAEQGVRAGDSDYTKLRKLLVQRILGERNPDLFFIKEVREGVKGIATGEAAWEESPWVSHGHTDMHPLSPSHRLRRQAPHDPEFFGWDLTPADLHPAEQVFTEDWRHPRCGESRRDPFEALGIAKVVR